MQFRVRDRDAIARGDVTLTFRRWRRPQARVGGRYRVGPYVIEVTSVDEIETSDITRIDARAAGHDGPDAVLNAISRNQRASGDPDAQLYRVAFHCLGQQADPRTILAQDGDIDAPAIDQVSDRLSKMDARSRRGPWTRATLEAIEATPGRRAAELAAEQGCETAKFKTDVRKLKGLGLTISLEVGYELSPRGRAVLDALQASERNR